MVILAVFAPIILLLLFWAVWDILVLSGKVDQPLITDEMRSLSRQYPMIPATIGLVVGVLIGHFYWN